VNLNPALAREGLPVQRRETGDEQRLVERVAAGDRNALADLYSRYQALLFRYLLQLTTDRGLAEEILQDTLVAVWQSARTFEGRSSLASWLVGVARRQAHNTLRRRSLPLADAAELEVLPASDPEPEDAALASAEQEELARAIAQLAPVHREVLTLTFTNGFSYAEIARIVGVPEGTVKSRLSNAKRALRALLEGVSGVGCRVSKDAGSAPDTRHPIPDTRAKEVDR
jgi:RNA polymerase sigma-70 factor (ECF subfamily)